LSTKSARIQGKRSLSYEVPRALPVGIYLSMALSHMIAPNLTERIGSRKRIILPAVLVDASMRLPILFIAFLFNENSFLFLLIFGEYILTSPAKLGSQLFETCYPTFALIE
jgi:hypothetical protein